MSSTVPQLIAVLGSGGVGKTTSSASLALSLGAMGQRVVVITVDPAHRLAQVLGLDSLSNEPKEIRSFPNGGRVSALWLDTKTALEDLIRQHAAQIPNIDKVLEHRLFKILQNQLGGIEEYLGVEKILNLRDSGDFDVCILDTPPSRHALDFLESPKHLLRFFDEGVLKVFLDTTSKSDPGGFFSRLLNSGRNQVIDIFKGFLGSSFIGELGDLLKSLKPIHAVFLRTAGEIDKWVNQPDTRFVLVSLLESYPLDEARLLQAELIGRELGSASLIILNKCLPQHAAPESALAQVLGSEAATQIVNQHAVQMNLREKLIKEMPPGTAFAEVPRYSVKHLSFDQLMKMGTEIVTAWKSKDPTISSKN